MRARPPACPLLLLASGAALAGCAPAPMIAAAILGVSRDGGGGGGGSNAAPTLVLRTPASPQRGGLATIELELADAENDPAALGFAFSVGGSAFAPATAAAESAVASGSIVDAPAGGASYAFVWDTAADGIENSAEVFLAVTATGARGGSVRATTGRLTVVNVPLAIDTSALPLGTDGLPALEATTAVAPGATGPAYAFDATALLRGGLPPYRVTIEADPPLLGLGGESGALAGVPRRSGRYVLTIAADDGTLDHVEAQVTLAVRPAVRVPVKALPPAAPGVEYDRPIPVRGGVPPYAFALAPGGALPDGLALDPAGRVHGTPAAPGIAAFTVRVTDAEGFAAEAPLRLRVAEPSPLAPPPALPILDASGPLLRHVTADVDGDGRDDLVRIAWSWSLFQNAFEVHLAQADGSFAPPAAIASSAPPPPMPTLFSAKTGDWNADGRADFLLRGDNFGTGATALLTSTPAPLVYDVATPSLGIAAAAGDFDGAGGAIVYTSIVFPPGEEGEDPPPPASELYILRTPHAPSATPALVASVTGLASPGVVAADLDGDGRDEIHALDRIYAWDSASAAFVERLSLPGPSADPFLPEVALPLGGGAHAVARIVPDATPRLDVTRFDGSFATGTPPPAAVPLGAVPIDGSLLGFAPPRLVAGAIGAGGAPGIALAGSGPVFLVTVAGAALSPASLDGDHVAFAAPPQLTGGGLAGRARAPGAAERVLFVDATFEAEKLLALTPDPDGQLAPYDARTLPLFTEGALPLPLRGEAGPDMAIQTSLGVGYLVRSSPDATGRLGPAETLVPLVDGESVISATAIRDGAGGVRLVALVSPLAPVARMLDIYEPAAGAGPPARALRIDLPGGDFVTASDLDGDGRDEVVVVENEAIATYVVATDGATSAAVVASVFSEGGTAQVVDLDRDGLGDLAFTLFGSLVGVRQAGALAFEPSGTLWQVALTGFGTTTLIADVDGDDTPDAVTGGTVFENAGSAYAIAVARNVDGAFLAPEEAIRLPFPNPTIVGVTDANLDGAPDLLLRDGQALGYLFGDGDGGFQPGDLVDYGALVAFSVIADLDQDGVDDVVGFFPNLPFSTVVTLFGDGRGGFRRADPKPPSE